MLDGGQDKEKIIRLNKSILPGTKSRTPGLAEVQCSVLAWSLFLLL